MENQIEKFDPSKLMDGVRDRIKATFVSLIPDEMWNAMVEKEIYVFTTGRIVQHHDYVRTKGNGEAVYSDWEERIPYEDVDVKDQWGNVKKKAEISPLRQMIREELREKFCKDLRRWLDSEEYQSAFDEYGTPEISKAVEEILVRNADSIFHNFMASLMQNAFVAMKNHIYSAMSSGNYSNY